MREVPPAAVGLSLVAIASATAASVATLLWPGAFPVSAPALVGNAVLAEARGLAAATLLVATPLAVVALRSARHGSLRGRLIWLGTMAYFVYVFLELAVSPPFTALFLAYVVAFACAIPALVMGVASIDTSSLPVAFGGRVPRRGVAIFALVLAVVLAAAWLKIIATRTMAGAFGWPAGADAVGLVVRALDLGLQVPLALAAAVLLLRRRAAGLLVASIMLVNGVCMGAALIGMVLGTAAEAGTSFWSATPFAIAWAIGIFCSIVFFRAGVDITRVQRRGFSGRHARALT
jgi:hypothetical protein